jgi:hypothetical protein
MKTNARKPPQATPPDAALCPAREGSGRIAQVPGAVTPERAKEVGLRTAQQSVAWGAGKAGNGHGVSPSGSHSAQRLTIKRGGWFLFAVCASDVRPIDIRAKLLDLDGSVALALDGNGNAFANALVDAGGLAQVANGGATAGGKRITLGWRERGEVSEDFFHTSYLTRRYAFAQYPRGIYLRVVAL